MIIGLIFIVFLALLMLGIPIVISIGVTTIFPLLTNIATPYRVDTIVRWAVQGADSITVIAIPMFILAGAIMSKGGVSKKLFDVFAYFVGKRFGRRRLAPILSPKKTLEGAIGGLLGSVLVSYLFASYIYPFLSLPKMLLLGLMVGVAAEVGDLLESAFKREAGIKDSSMLIPGHGGILDRFDSALFTAPLVYYFVLLFIIS